MKTILVLITIALSRMSALADDSGFKYAHEAQPTQRQTQAAQKQYNPAVNAVVHYNANHGTAKPPSRLGQQSNPPAPSQSGRLLKSASAQ